MPVQQLPALAGPAAPTVSQAPSAATRSPRDTTAIVLFVLGGLGLAAAIFLGLFGMFWSAFPMHHGTTVTIGSQEYHPGDQGYDQALDTAQKIFRTVGKVMLGGSAASALVGVVLIAFGVRRRRRAPRAP